MSVLIKGANIPVMGCLYCQLRNGDNCVASDILDVSEQVYKSTKERHPDCPLVEIPTPHGRLIDADELLKNHAVIADKEFIHLLYRGTVRKMINKAATIIEAEVSNKWEK